MNDLQREAIETIALESERLLHIARGSGEQFLAYLLESVLHETRSILIGSGHDVPHPVIDPSSAVVPIIRRVKR